MNSSICKNGRKSNLWISLGIIMTFVNLTFLRSANAFNIDVADPVKFTGPPRSYFGYSVSLLKNSKGNWIIIGAPRANSTSFPKITEPGEIYKCHMTTGNCTRVQLDKDPISKSREKGREYTDKKDNMWLGVSVDTTMEKGGRMVACAHLWKNIYWTHAHRVNGICYTLDKELDQSSLEKLSPLIAYDDQSYAKYAGAQQGISAHFAKNSDDLLVGAPGISYWKGSSVYLSRDGFGKKLRTGVNTYEDVMVPVSFKDMQDDAYFGSAVTSGQFTKTGPVMFAIGAPRQNNKGKIYIVDIIYKRYVLKVDKTGEQMGEYFGSALCAVDLNKDGLDDLLVGAPMYTKYSDEGKVYIYINKGNALFQLSPESLMGSQKVGARFGSSMAVIGDVNMDGYLDVAIGAPFEDSRGAVFIYHGNADGLKSRYQQKIKASHGSQIATGFGVSIAKGMDLDGNNYPDLAIGAYNSSEAFVFRAIPVAYLKGTIIPSLSQLNMDDKSCKYGSQNVSCFTLEVCVSYRGKYVPETLDINFFIQVDSLKEDIADGTRVFLNSNNKMTDRIQENTIVSLSKSKCQQHTVYALKVPADYMTPIQIFFKYDLVPKVNPQPGFCAKCPILDELEQTQKTEQVRFMKNCGADEKCDTDIKLAASIQDFGLQDVFVIGSRDNLVLLTEISNEAEPAYATVLTIIIPNWMTINKKPVSCEFTIDNPHKLFCMVANPLESTSKVSFEFQLNLEKIPVNNELISIELQVRSDSTEDISKLKDNNATLEIQTKAMADAFIIGSTPNEQIFFKETDQGKILENATALFSHTYVVFNNGPSTIQQITVNVMYPANSLDGQKKLVQIRAINTIDGKKGATFGSCDGISEQFSSTTERGPEDGTQHSKLENRKRREASEKISRTEIQKDAFILNCSSAVCETVSCIVGPFTKDASATLAVTFVVSVFNLSSIMSGNDMTTIITEGQVIIDHHQIITQPDLHKPDFAKVSTDVKSSGAPPPKALASWIIPVSACGGILLLILLAVVLVKLGFFRRKKKEEMQRLLAQENSSPSQKPIKEIDG